MDLSQLLNGTKVADHTDEEKQGIADQIDDLFDGAAWNNGDVVEILGNVVARRALGAAPWGADLNVSRLASVTFVTGIMNIIGQAFKENGLVDDFEIKSGIATRRQPEDDPELSMGQKPPTTH